MSEFVKPYNDDPFVGNLSTPVTTSVATKLYLGNLPIYRKGLSPLMRGLEIGMAHGYFLIGPLSKFKNVHAKKVARSLISKMNNNEIKGKQILYYDDFKNY